MTKDPYRYEIEIDDPPRRGRTALMWIVFIIIFLAVIACAVWVFCFSSRGLNFEHHSPAPEKQLSAPAAAPPVLPFVGVSLSATTLTLKEGDRAMLTPTLKLAAGSPYINVMALPLRWRSADAQVVSVNSHGELVARSPGRSRISVAVADSRVDANEAYCMVEVRPSAMLHHDSIPEDSASTNQNQ